MKRFLLTSVLLLWAGLAHAALFVCGDATQFFSAQFADPATPPACPAPFTRAEVSTGDTPGQQTILSGAIPKRYLKVVGGLVVEKTQGEKDAVDAALAAAQATQEALETEANDPNCRNVRLEQLDTFFDTLATNLQGDIDGISNIATAKTELADAFQRVVVVLRKLAKCVRATGR